jgi:hypothetical protein
MLSAGQISQAASLVGHSINATRDHVPANQFRDCRRGRGFTRAAVLFTPTTTAYEPMEATLEGLNAAQRAAVTSSSPILQVLAPPGSGKTKALTARVAYLLAHHGYQPGNVICCTFTIKASREMRERLRSLIGSDLESKLVLGTFHSICRRYLVTYGYLIGIPKDFGIADSSDTLSILKRIIKRLNFNLDPKAARSRISHRKARGLREERVRKTCGGPGTSNCLR